MHDPHVYQLCGYRGGRVWFDEANSTQGFWIEQYNVVGKWTLDLVRFLPLILVLHHSLIDYVGLSFLSLSLLNYKMGATP